MGLTLTPLQQYLLENAVRLRDREGVQNILGQMPQEQKDALGFDEGTDFEEIRDLLERGELDVQLARARSRVARLEAELARAQAKVAELEAKLV